MDSRSIQEFKILYATGGQFPPPKKIVSVGAEPASLAVVAVREAVGLEVLVHLGKGKAKKSKEKKREEKRKEKKITKKQKKKQEKQKKRKVKKQKRKERSPKFYIYIQTPDRPLLAAATGNIVFTCFLFCFYCFI